MRQFKRSPLFFVTAVATLGLGIAMVVAMFTIFDRVVLRPVRLVEPAGLVALRARNPGVNFVPPTLSWPRFTEIQRNSASFSGLAAYSNEAVNLTGGDGSPEQLRALRVSGAFFTILRLSALEGRLLTEADDVPNGPAVCVLSYSLWQSRYGGRDIVGRTLQLDDARVEVVGVLPPSLTPPWGDREIFLPRVFEDSALSEQAIMNGASYLSVVGRLRPGVRAEQASEELGGLSATYAREHPARGDAGNEVDALSFTEFVAGDRRMTFAVLFGAVIAVLLVACTNVTALALNRVAARQREFAVRRALGASRGRLLRQLSGEGFTVAAWAGVVGFGLAQAMLTVGQSALANHLPTGTVLRMSPSAIWIGVGAAALTGLFVGLVPALLAVTPPDSTTPASSDCGLSQGRVDRRTQAGLMVTETTAATVLLTGAVLLSISLVKLQLASPGFDPSGVATAFTTLSSSRYPTADQRRDFFLGVVDRLRVAPGVSSVAVVFGLPFHDENYAHAYAVSGRPVPALADRSRAGLRIVTDAYFEVMRMRLVEGRTFNQDDRPGAPAVCVVNEALARRLFAGRSALGEVILRGREADQPVTVVGVVADVKTNGLRADTPDEIFYSFRQSPRTSAAIVARTDGDPVALAPRLRAVVNDLDPHQPLLGFAAMTDRLAGTLRLERLLAGITIGFAGLAVGLAAMGLYAVLSHGVATRRRELGLRLALGATRVGIVRVVVGRSLRIVAVGVAIGLVAAFCFAGLLTSQLYGVDARDLRVYTGVAAVFLVVSTMASLKPALHASRCDPRESLDAS